MRRSGKLTRPQWSGSPSAVGPHLGWKTGSPHWGAVDVVWHCLFHTPSDPAMEWDFHCFPELWCSFKMWKPAAPVPSDSLLYVPAMFVKPALTQTQEIGESMHV